MQGRNPSFDKIDDGVDSAKSVMGSSISAVNPSNLGSSDGLHLPLFPGFKSRIFPLLLLYWIVAIAISLLYGSGVPLVIAGWLSPTTIMLWPVGRGMGLKYIQYRTPWFIGSVLSMSGVPLSVLWIVSTPMTDQVTKHVALVILIAVVIGFFGVEVAHEKAFGKPLKMFFRPDLILGPNRILAGGLAALAIGMKFMFTNAPPGDTPVGNWYAFFIIIILGLYQLIPLRGLVKMRTMVSRMLYDKKRGFGITALKELYLIVAISLMLFAAHNFFGGVVPFTRQVLAGSVEGTVIMILAGAFVVLVRAWYKKHIGDPFFKETISQSVWKDLILAIGMTAYFYGYVNVMVDHFPRTLNLGTNTYLSELGLGLYLWGLILLIPLRAWARQNQQRGIIEQMVGAMLPSLDDEQRTRIMKKVLSAILDLPEHRRLKVVRSIVKTLGRMNPVDRDKVMSTQLYVLSSLPAGKRLLMIKAMDKTIMG
jgi:hypothetical protein